MAVSPLAKALPASCMSAKPCPNLCNPLTIGPQASLSMGIFMQEHWSGLPFPPPDLPDPGMETASPAVAGRFFTTEPPGEPC